MTDQDHPPNIYVVGPQCTGKTSLVNALKVKAAGENYSSVGQPHVISEVARSVLSKSCIATEEIRASPEQSLKLQRLIIAAQAEAEQQALSKARWFISDRSGIDPIVYATRYASVESAGHMQRSPTWLELRDRMANGLIILCEPISRWLSDDGTRLMPLDLEDWQQFYHSFCRVLEANRLPYHVLPAKLQDSEARLDFVLSEWHRQLTAKKGDESLTVGRPFGRNQ